MSEPQLERSVLEAKEREELFAIAEALGARPTSRARKGDLVNTILRATGVEVTPEPEAPARRTRARKAPAKRAGEADAAAGEESTDQPGPPAEAPSPDGGAAAAGAADELPFEEAAPAADAQAADSQPADAEPAEPAGVQAAQSGVAEGGSAPLAGASPAVAAGPAPANGGGSPAPSRPTTAPRPPRPPRSGFLASPDGGTSGAVPSGTRAPRPGVPERRGRNGQSDARPAPARTEGPSAGGSPPAPSAPPPAGGESEAGGEPAPASATASSSGEGVEPRQRPEGETGNRRNRRRRGRDRGERNLERDLPNQNTEVPYTGEPLPVSGYLDLRDEGYGFLRTNGFHASQADVYVSISQVRRFALRKGDWVEGASRPAAATEKYPALLRIDTVAGLSPDDARSRPSFDELTAVTPSERIPLAREDDPGVVDVRLIDLFAPIARGQRALVTGPPRAGKTALLVDIVTSLEARHPELELLVLVVDERPEEVTELRRAVRTEVLATTFDRPAEEHVQVAELVVERAKRMVEAGADVVVVADGLTRLARAYNLVPSGSSRVLPGGIDAGAVGRPLGLFGAGRNIEGGGSLTLVATALVETGSRLDEVVYEELTAAANVEVRLDRALAERAVRPPIDVARSWARGEDRLLDGGTLERVRALRLRTESGPALVDLLERLGATKSNEEFLDRVEELGDEPSVGAAMKETER